jgi:1-acyl-sn-glycerol-3-phosphate acyltransferase
MIFSNVRPGSIIIAKPYRFVPPYRGTFWTTFYRPFGRAMARRLFGVTKVEIRGGHHLRDSVARGDGILIASNHCRHSDPFLLGLLNAESGQPLHVMATWHLFNQGLLLALLLRRIGAFSVYREGPDRVALKTAVALLAEARRPLVIFPEGMASRSNHYLRPFMDGLALIARAAARQRSVTGGGIAVHPVAIRYRFEGAIDTTLAPRLEKLEMHIGWPPGRDASLLARAFKMGEELLARAEEKHFGARRSGAAPQRMAALIEHLLVPLETKWLGAPGDGESFARMKRVRGAILPALIAGSLSETEIKQRWNELALIDEAERWYRNPPTHLVSCATPEQLLETVERIEEMMMGRARPCGPLRAVIDVDPPIKLGGEPAIVIGANELLEQIRTRMEAMLVEERRPQPAST